MKHIIFHNVSLSFLFIFLFSQHIVGQITVQNGESIQAAINNASPGTVITVNAGNYSEKIRFSGSSDDNITLVANGPVLIDGTNLTPNGREGLITISGSDDVHVEGFSLTNFKTSTTDTPTGILVDNGSTNIKIINNTISYIENNRSNCNQDNNCYVGAHGIAVFGNTTTAISNILIQGNEVSNCDLMSSEAFVLNGNVDGFEVYDNIVHDNDNIGFDFIGYEPYDCSSCSPEQLRVKNGLVAGNTAYRNSSGTNPHYTGDKSAGGFYVDGGRNIIFAGNISYENDFGIEFGSEWNNRKTENILMVNNLIYNNTQTGLILGGYSQSTGNTGNGGGGGSAENIYVYNNTFYGNNFAQITFQYRVRNSRFFNNILYTVGDVASAGFGKWCSNCNESANSWGSNVWYGTGGNGSGFPGTNNIIADPSFSVTGSDFSLNANSPAIGMASTQSDLTNWTSNFWIGFFYANGTIPAHGTIAQNTIVDLAGNDRFQSTLDIGAYEYNSGLTNVPVLGVSVTPPAASLTVDQTQTLTATINPSNATNQNLIWSSQFPTIASVSASGLVTALAEGSSIITVTTVDGNFTDTSVITVTAVTSSDCVEIDGNFADWANIPSVSLLGSGGLLNFKVADNEDYLYAYINGDIGVNFQLYLDVDNDNSGTNEYNNTQWSTNGLNYMIENGSIYQYTGSGSNWSWNFVGTGLFNKTTSGLEIEIPKTVLTGSSTTINLGFASLDNNYNEIGHIPNANTAAPYTLLSSFVDCNTTCPNSPLILSGNLSTSLQYGTNGLIESNQSLSDNIDVQYNSKVSIEFTSGFTTGSATTIHAYIEGCQ